MIPTDKIKSLLRHNITKGAIGSFALNIINQVLILGILITLTRLMTPDEFGLYSIILSVMILCALPITGGFLTFIIRHVSKYKAIGDEARLKGVRLFSMLWICGGGILLFNIVFFIAPIIWHDDYRFFQIGASFIFLNATLLFIGAYFRGLNHVIIGRFFEFFLQPFLLLCIIIFIAGLSDVLSLDNILIYHIVSLIISIALFFLLSLFFIRPKKIKAVYDFKNWIKSVVPFIAAVGLVIANTHIDIIMVGALASEEDAGFYKIASRLAAFVPFFLFALNNVLAPRISALYSEGKKDTLQNILTLASRIVLALTAPLALILIIFPVQILDIAFGSEYTIAAVALIILAIANLFSVMMGQVGQVMALTGFEKITAYTVLMALVINILLNYILVPHMGIEGAAIATATSIIIWNIVLAHFTVKKTGLHCSALGPIRKRAS